MSTSLEKHNQIHQLILNVISMRVSNSAGSGLDKVSLLPLNATNAVQANPKTTELLPVDTSRACVSARCVQVPSEITASYTHTLLKKDKPTAEICDFQDY